MNKKMSSILMKVKDLVRNGNLADALIEINLYKDLGDFSDEIIILSSRQSDLENSKIKGIISFEEYSRLNAKIVDSLLLIIRNIEKENKNVKSKLEYGDEYSSINEKRWGEQVLNGELGQLIDELLFKEKQNTLLKQKELREEFHSEINKLSNKISNEFLRLKHLFQENKFLPNLIDSTFIGIDFGTSNTVISYMCYYSNRKDFKLTLPQPVELAFHKPKFVNEFIIPSTIFYDEESDFLHFGIDAKRNKKHIHEEGTNFWSSFKTKLGFNTGNIFYNSKLKVGHKHCTILSPDQAAEIFLRWIKKQIEEYIREKKLPENIYYSFSIPASFGSNKRESYLKILKSIGIDTNESVLIDEPNAAFLNCLISLPPEKIKDFQQSHVLVFDFGAGTCDISILEFWKDGKGAYHSKNFSTSSDNLIGGDNIDLKIAEEILFDSFITEFDLKGNYMTPVQKNLIFNNLKPIAENLKINACKRLLKKPKLDDTESIVTTNELIVIQYNGKNYNMEDFELSFSEFKKIMLPFIDKNSNESIFRPIDIALDNAKMTPDDIDYVLMIGGSCKNPYIKKALEEHFEETEVIESGNLQTHVSKGVALNTALIHGSGKKVIDPVVSETISIKLNDGTLLPIIVAGTPIPLEEFFIKNLKISRERQTEIEIPIFSTGAKKMIANFRIKGNFEATDHFDLEFSVDKNKKVILNIFIFRNNNTLKEKLSSIQFLPYSNEIISDYDRVIKKMERKLFAFLSEGKDHSNSYSVKNIVSKIADLHADHGNHKKALNIYLDYSPGSYTNISYQASKCDEEEIKLKYTKLAYERDKDGVSAYNYALEFGEDSEDYEKLIKEATEKGHATAKYEYGLLLLRKYNDKEGEFLIKDAYKEFKNDFQTSGKGLPKWKFRVLKAVAKYYKDNETLHKIKILEKELQIERAKMRKVTNIDNYFKNN